MFKRKIEKELDEWKKSLQHKRKALVLKGLRQVGKTSSILEFAKKHYANVVYINFKLEPSMKEAFYGDLDVDTIVMNLSSLMPRASFVPHKTVLIFDEIQECSGARASLKSFVEFDDRYDVMASGSLLGIKGYNAKYHGGSAVGYEHVLYLRPMDFEEYLWANGIGDDLIGYLRDCFIARTPVRSPIHESMLRYFREYLCVGGMPAIVQTFINTGNMRTVYKEQIDLLESYKDDYGKHLDQDEKEHQDLTLLSRINRVYQSIPAQLAKENKKFFYSQLGNKANSKAYDPAIQWLSDYGLIHYCYNLHLLEKPLAGNMDEGSFKLYVCDTGLFTAMLGQDAYADVLLGDLGIFKGAMYENIIADGISKMGRPLFYYSKSSGLEIDFIIEFQKRISLVEVKATNGNTKSSATVLKNKSVYPSVSTLIKFGSIQVSETIDEFGNTKITLPYYMVFLLNEGNPL